MVLGDRAVGEIAFIIMVVSFVRYCCLDVSSLFRFFRFFVGLWIAGFIVRFVVIWRCWVRIRFGVGVRVRVGFRGGYRGWR